MTKADLVDRAATAIGQRVTKRDCGLVIDAFLDTVKDALARGDHIEIRGFGTFKVRHRKARRGRNPKTGEPVEVPSRKCTGLPAVETPPGARGQSVTGWPSWTPQPKAGPTLRAPMGAPERFSGIIRAAGAPRIDDIGSPRGMGRVESPGRAAGARGHYKGATGCAVVLAVREADDHEAEGLPLEGPATASRGAACGSVSQAAALLA